MQNFSTREHRDFYRRNIADQLAASAQLDYMYMGFFDCSHKLFSDWWCSHDLSKSESPGPDKVLEMIHAVSQAISRSNLCQSANLATARRGYSAETYWEFSDPYLVGVGGQVGGLVPVILAKGDAITSPAKGKDVLQIGMSYVAQELHGALPAQKPRSNSAIEQVLNMLSIHFAVVDCYGEIDYGTDFQSTWLTAERSGLSMCSNRLRAPSKTVQKDLLDALLRATGPARRPSVISTGAEDARHKIAVVLPMQKSFPPRALVILESGSDDPVLRDHILALSGLTNSERRVAHHVLDGRSLAEVAEETNLSLATVRSYMKGIFAKTSTHRQSELITHFRNAVPRVKFPSETEAEPS